MLRMLDNGCQLVVMKGRAEEKLKSAVVQLITRVAPQKPPQHLIISRGPQGRAKVGDGINLRAVVIVVPPHNWKLERTLFGNLFA